MAIRFIPVFICVCFINACGGGSGSSTTSNHSSAASSIAATSTSSSSAAAMRQPINASEANFFQEPGLWLAWTRIDARNRSAQNDLLKPFREERSRDTSISTYLFAPESNELAPGACIRTLSPEQINGAALIFFSSAPIGNELYCMTENQFYREVDGSYSIEYRCDNNVVATTRLVKASSLPEFQDTGLTLSGAPLQEPVCVSWNMSSFEIWSLDANGNEIQREADAMVINDIQMRVGMDNESSVIHFRSNQGAWHAGVYDLAFWDFITPQLRESATAEITTANAGITPEPGKSFSAQQGELRIDRIEPLRMSGSFTMQGTNNESLSGFFSFDFSEYFTE